MLYRNQPKNQSGFSIVELIVVMVLVGIGTVILFTFVVGGLRQYLGLQKDASGFSDLSIQSQRITNVLRGATDVTEATNDSITVYAYFYPNNQNVSLIRYYLNATRTTLYADVTAMSANPPIGTPVSGSLKTYTIIPYFYQPTGSKLFVYQDLNGNDLSLPINDLTTVKAIQINLQTPNDGFQKDASQSITTEVSLRNRKTNL